MILIVDDDPSVIASLGLLLKRHGHATRAALSQEDARLVEEVADLAYHVLVLLAARGITLQEVAQELENRKK